METFNGVYTQMDADTYRDVSMATSDITHRCHHPRIRRWRACCCDCFSQQFENLGLLFRDREKEVNFLLSKQTPVARLVVPLATSVCLLMLVALLSLPGSLDNWLFTALACVLALLPLSGLVITCACRCKRSRGCSMWQMSSYHVGVIGFWIGVVSVAVNVITVPWVIQSNTECNELMDTPSLWQNWTCANYTSWGNGTDFARMSKNFRLCGFMRHAPSLVCVTLGWTLQTVLIAANTVAARQAIVASAVNIAVLLVSSVIALLHSVPWNAVACIPMLTAGTSATAVKLFAGCIAASGAVLWVAFQRSSAQRDLFFLTHQMKVDAAILQNEGDPFNPRLLRRWLNASNSLRPTPCNKPRAPAKNRGSATFWAIAPTDLTLGAPIASGSSGMVRKATYKGELIVAAKQLYELPSGDALDILSHEVAVLGQLSHQHIVKFLGLCTLPADRVGGQPQLFIVQEFCQTNLRDLIINSALGHTVGSGFSN